MKTTNTNNRKSRKMIILAAVALVSLLAGGGILMHRHQQNNEAIAKERAQYAQAEKELDTLSAQIIAKLGQPDDSKKVKECGYTSSKFGTGALFCNVGQYILYPSQNIEKARQQVEDTKAVSQVFNNLKPGDEMPNLATVSYKSNELSCSIGFSIHEQSESLESMGYANVRLKNSAQGLLIELSCSSENIKGAHYPIIET